MKLTDYQVAILKKESARCHKATLSREGPMISYAARREACEILLWLDSAEKEKVLKEPVVEDPSEQI